MKTSIRASAWIGAATLLLLGFAWLAGWFNDRAQPGEEPARSAAKSDRLTAEVTAKTVDTFVPVPGRLRAEYRTRITSELVGKIVEITVAAGDRVKVGDPLVRLDRTELLARVKAIREQLPARRIRLSEVQAEFDRIEQLRKDAAISQDRLETTRRLLAEAKANLGAVEQELLEAEGQLDEAVIKATIGGTVVDRLGKVGEVARPGAALMEIYQPESLRLECQVPESLVDGLRVGQNLRAEIGSSQHSATVKVDEIVPQADARSRTVLVKARLPDATKWIEGQYGRLFVPLSRESKLFVPVNAIQSIGQLDFVEVVSKTGGIERRFVKLATTSPENEIEILSGLEAGERVMLATSTGSSSVLRSDERN